MKHVKRLCLILAVILALSAIGYGVWYLCARDPGITKSYTVTLSPGEITMLPDPIRTNSTKISVSLPRGAPEVTVYLYNTDSETPIQQKDLRAGEHMSFNHLTSRYLYALGVQPKDPVASTLSLNVQYLPIP